MEPFSALLALCEGNSPVTCEFPSQRPVTRCCAVFFDLRLNKRLSKQSRPDDLRRHGVHYDVIVMCSWDVNVSEFGRRFGSSAVDPSVKFETDFI